MIQRPRGTRDFGPDEMEKRRCLEAIMRREAAVFGFREIATPIFEHTELFTLRSGPNVVEEIYAFKDKGGREISLRPELTAPAMRFFVNELSNSARPLKMFYFGQCFRYERPQSGRFREFFQFGAELIGNPGPESDAEVIALAASIMRRIGLKNYNIRMGHIGVLRSMLAEAGVDAKSAPLILQKLDKKEYDEARQRMQDAGMDEERIESGHRHHQHRRPRRGPGQDRRGGPRAPAGDISGSWKHTASRMSRWIWALFAAWITTPAWCSR
jgi:histidyl-tRNA synthetase